MELTPVERHWALGPVLAVCLGAISNLVLYTSYATGDDVGLRMITEGRFVPGGAPSAETHFMSLVMGWLLVSLHAFSSTIPWFDLILNGAILSAFLLSITLLQKRADILFRPCLAIICASFLWMLVFPTFTVAAVVSAGVGALVLTFSGVGWLPDIRRIERFLILGLSSVAMVVGFLLREIAALAGVIVVAIVVASALVARIPVRRGSLIAASCLSGVAVIACLVAHQCEAAYYTLRPEWGQFTLFNIERARISNATSSGLTADNDRDDAGNGFSHDDEIAIQQSLYFDKSVFPAERVIKAGQYYASRRLDPKALVIQLFDEARQAVTAAPLILGLLVFTWMRRPASREGLGTIASVVAITVLFLLLAIAFKSTPWRVVWPLSTALFVGASALPFQAIQTAPDRIGGGRTILTGLAAFIFCMTILDDVLVWRRFSDLPAEIAKLEAMRLGVIVAVGSAIPYQHLDLPFHRSVIQHPISILPVGVYFRSPVVQRMIAGSQYADLASHVCGDRYLPVALTPKAVPAFVTYYRHHHHLDVQFNRLTEASTFAIYRCRILRVAHGDPQRTTISMPGRVGHRALTSWADTFQSGL